jgi:hypothetical protein
MMTDGDGPLIPAIDVSFACAGVPQMLRALADDHGPGPVRDLALKEADRISVLLKRCAE